MELQPIQSKIYEIRGQRVMLDFDLAELYQVETKRLKEAVRRNIERFEGDDFMFVLSEKEYAYWQDVLATIQASEDMRYAMKDKVNLKEVDDYIFEDAQYLTDIRSTAETEYYCLKEVEKALKDEDRDWFAAHGFVKTLKGELDDKSEE